MPPLLDVDGTQHDRGWDAEVNGAAAWHSAREDSATGRRGLGRSATTMAAGVAAVLCFALAVFWTVTVAGLAARKQSQAGAGELLSRDEEPTFQCKGNTERWQTEWSDQQKSFCCSNYRIGCTAGLADLRLKYGATSYDCSAGAASWQRGWSRKKKDYCCRSINVGCVSINWTLWIFLGIIAGLLIFAGIMLAWMLIQRTQDQKRFRALPTSMTDKHDKERCCSCSLEKDERSCGWGGGKGNGLFGGHGGHGGFWKQGGHRAHNWSEAKRGCTPGPGKH